jgi:hypothetical protein
MTKIIFWLNAFLLNFCVSHYIQKTHDYELYSIIDVPDKTKNFFEGQNFVNFQKNWFFNDYVNKPNSIPDLEYLKNFEKKYSIDLWQLGFNERIFYYYNKLYKFTQNQILSILEQECKFFENILEEVKPDFLIIPEMALHQEQLFYKLCRKKGIKTLLLYMSKIGNMCTISQEYDKFDFLPILDQIPLKNKTFDDMLSLLKSKNLEKQTKFYSENFGNSKLNKIKTLIKYITSDNSNITTHFAYYGRTKTRVLSNYFSLFLKTKKRKSFLDKNSEFKIHEDEKFVLYTLNQEPEKSILLLASYYTNQLEVIRHIAKSLPIGFKLYVKEHFSQSLREWRDISYYKEILDIPNVRFYHPSSNIENLIKKSSLVISIGGSTPFQAAFYQKPSITFADLGYTILPSVEKLNCLEDLPNLIKRTMNLKVDPNDLERYISIIMDNSFNFDFRQYEISEANYFRYGGNLHDVEITTEKMEHFLKLNQNNFEMIAEQYIKKLKNI